MANEPILSDMLDALVAQGRLDATAVERANAYLTEKAGHLPDGLLVRLFQGVSAWVASCILLLFLIALGVLNLTAGSMLFWAGGCFATACFLTRGKYHGSVMNDQFVIALALVAGGLFLGSILIMLDAEFERASFLTAAGIQGGITVLYYLIFSDRALRFLSGLFSLGFFGVWCFWPPIYTAPPTILAAACGVFLFVSPFIPNRHDIRAPLNVTAALVGLGMLVVSLFPVERLLLWPYQIVWTSLLVLVLVLKAQTRSAQTAWYIGAITALILGFFTHPGILAALYVLFVAHDRDERVLTALGLTFLPVFIVFYYYQLQFSLSEKAYILFASGALLLAVRWAILRYGGGQVAKEEFPS